MSLAAASRSRSQSPIRLIVGYGTIACALPYLALKAIWLTGGQLGVADAAVMADTSMVALNAVTAAMDLVGILIALAFTHSWGQRIPAWLVLPPIWVAMGLLVRFVVAFPITVVARAITHRSFFPPAGGPVRPWVYALVYTEFVGLGIGLTIAFVLYARARWGWAFRSNVRVSPGATHSVQVALANAAALMAAFVGVLHLAWALGATVGLPRALTAQRTFSSHVVNFVDGATIAAAATGVLMMVRWPGRRTPFWLPLSAAWVGSGFLFGWGLWGLINVLGDTALVRTRPATTSWLNLLGLVKLVAGLVIGLIVLFLLAERRAAQTADSQVSARLPAR